MNKIAEIKKIALIVSGLTIFCALIFGKSIYLVFKGDIQIPSQFNVFGATGHFYGLVLFAGIVVGYLVARKLARLEKINLDKYLLNFFVGFLIALLFARLGYVVFQLDRIETFGEVFATWQGGMSIHGALVGIGLYLWYLAWRYKISFSQFADFLVPGIILGQAIGRWGNFINQEAYGSPANVVWKMFITPGRRFLDLINESYYHPAFLYESIGDFLVFFILLYIFGVNKKPGNVALFYVLLYSVLRFVVEFWRIDNVMWSFLSVAQWFSVILIIISGYLLIARNKPKTAEEF
ncbi:MAG: prolipoprotein diacylglyceryl transferase [bacterium]